VQQIQMISWPDFGVPDSAEPIFQLKSMVDDLQTAGKTQAQRPPVVVHCSAGIGRTGSYMTISIGIDSLLNTGRCNIINTVKRIRGQRALSVQTADQYELCYTSLLEYAALHVASIEPREKIDILEFLNNWKKTQPDEHRW
jgi:protein tyrosine phosphatase